MTDRTDTSEGEDGLRALAAKAEAIDASAPDVECTIYFGYPGCEPNQEVRVATAYSHYWARWIAATTPTKVLNLLHDRDAAIAERDALRAERDAWKNEAEKERASAAMQREERNKLTERVLLAERAAAGISESASDQVFAMAAAAFNVDEDKIDADMVFSAPDEIRALRARAEAAEKERDLAEQETDAIEYMLTRRLGGRVEGAPTGTHNYLQRVDALREIERKAKSDAAHLAAVEKQRDQARAALRKVRYFMQSPEHLAQIDIHAAAREIDAALASDAATADEGKG